MAYKKLPDVDHLRKLFSYDPDTGVLMWREDATCKNGKARHPHHGRRAGDPNKGGYRIVVVDAVKYREHRICWAIVTGSEPTHEIDHMNGDPSDNRWCNLRPAEHEQNSRNTRRHKDNKSGFKGVDYVPKKVGSTAGPWRAAIYVDGKFRHIGFFGSPEAAHAAYCRAGKEHFGEFFNPG